MYEQKLSFLFEIFCFIWYASHTLDLIAETNTYLSKFDAKELKKMDIAASLLGKTHRILGKILASRSQQVRRARRCLV